VRGARWGLTESTVSIVGAALTTLAAALFLILFGLDLFGSLHNPYIGLLIYLALPAAFVLGLLLIPFGNWLARRRPITASGPQWPAVDLRAPHARSAVAFIVLATIFNIVIISMASYGAVHYMETPSFCGQVCHTVMQPEFVAYQNGPHARVACVGCHIGGGATAFAKAKFSGVRQLAHIAIGRYPRPIPVPVRNMRPARDTCEQCHWPEKFHGDKIKIVREYADDAANTETVTTLRVHVGGGSQKLGVATGIHWHMNLDNEVEYIASDARRQTIPYVRLKDRLGNVREYLAPGATPEIVANGERRRMDCIDCHSRPGHTMSATAERAVDTAIGIGAVPRALPFVRREIVKAIKADYPSQEAAASQIETAVRTFYRSQATVVDHRSVEAAVSTAQRLYRANVFPAMRVTWGTYPNELGHIDSPGCFRCHDDDHKTRDGKKIGQDCDTCHNIE
jgi:nitrate/TMAO reductase-like tetraheme cytochrome c subunit